MAVVSRLGLTRHNQWIETFNGEIAPMRSRLFLLNGFTTMELELEFSNL